MTIEEWKKELTEVVDGFADAGKNVAAHLSKLKEIDEESYDEDEVMAFVAIKIQRMQNSLEEAMNNL